MKIIRNFLWSFVILAIFIITSCSDSSGSSGEGGMTDVTAPEWITGYPKPIQLDDRIYVKAALNEKGRVCCVIVPDGAPAPSPQQIVDGQNSTGALVPERAHVDVDANETGTLMIAGLAYSSEYDLYCIALDDLQNRQESAAIFDISVSERNTIFVSKTDGDDSYPGTIFQPKKTIQSGISTANALSSSVKRVCVSQGTYVESVSLANGVSLLGGYSKFDWSERDIEDRTNSACLTVISGMGAVSYALAINGTNPGAGDWVIEGFTIESNDSNDSIGIWCYANSPVKIRYNTIDGGAGVDDSVGIYLTNNAVAEIANNAINGGNGSYQSSGICLDGDATGEITNNTIIGGTSVGFKSYGILITTSGDQKIINNTIDGGADNATSAGIEIADNVGYGTIIANNKINTIICSASNTNGIVIHHNTASAASTPLIYGNTIYGGDAYMTTIGILLYGSDAVSIAPVICNNVIQLGTGQHVFGISLDSIDGHAYLYNNIIHAKKAAPVMPRISGIAITSALGQESFASLINNIIFNADYAIIENDGYSICSTIKNNNFYNCESVYNSSVYGLFDTVDDLNGSSYAWISGNVPDDALLDDARNFSPSSPASVTGGGLDLSSYPYFQKNSSGQKIDLTGKVRTAPWSIGAYEKE